MLHSPAPICPEFIPSLASEEVGSGRKGGFLGAHFLRALLWKVSSLPSQPWVLGQP